MNDSQIAETFVRLFKSLTSAPDANTVLGVRLSSVPPNCRPKCLIVMRCDSDDLSLTSIMRDTWIIDDDGIHRPTTSPFPDGPFANDWHLTSPYVKFSTNGELIHYGLQLGDDWYRCFRAPLASFPDGEGTIELVFDSTRPLRVEE